MKYLVRHFAMALSMAALFASSVGVQAQESEARLISFDVPGAGAGANQGTGCFGCTFAINGAGFVVGTATDASNSSYGFLRSPDGKFVSFQAPGAYTAYGTFAQGINDAGVITGFYYDGSGVSHGFVRSPEGVFSSFDAPGAVNGTTPLFIGRNGDVVGYALDANLLFHAFLRRADGRVLAFVGPNSCTTGTPAGCYGNEATFVDGSGRAFGNFTDNSGNLVGHGMIRSPEGHIAVFDAPGAGAGFFQGTGCPGCNFGVNRWGAIAGIFTDASGAFHTFVRGPEGRFVTVDVPGAGSGAYQGTGCFSDCPVGLNDNGELTGSFQDAAYVQHGFVRGPSGSISTFDPTGSIATQPESINNSGTIVGYYVDAVGAYHGFLRIKD